VRVPFGVPTGTFVIQEARDFPPGSLLVRPANDDPAEWFIFLRDGQGGALLFTIHAPTRGLSRGDLVRCSGELAGLAAGFRPNDWSVAIRPETAQAGKATSGRLHVGESGELLLGRFLDSESFVEARHSAGLPPQVGLIQTEFLIPLILQNWALKPDAIYEAGMNFDWTLRVCGAPVED
jgi:hypothetical protein